MFQFCWDEDNTEHIDQHGVTPEEWEQAFLNAKADAISRSSRRPVRFGYTLAGRFLFVCFDREIVDDVCWVTPVTGYEVEA